MKGKRQGRRKNRQVVSLVRQPGAQDTVPSNRRVRLTYADSGTFITGSAIGSIAFRANSVYDPYYPAGGHQPLGFDQWAAFYKEYVVLSATARVSVCPSSNDRTYPFVSNLRVVGDASTATSINNAAETPKSSTKLHLPDWDATGAMQHHVQHFDAKKWFNVIDVLDNSDRFGALVTADPSEESYFQLTCDTIPISNSWNAKYYIIIEYDVVFSRPKVLPSS